MQRQKCKCIKRYQKNRSKERAEEEAVAVPSLLIRILSQDLSFTSSSSKTPTTTKPIYNKPTKKAPQLHLQIQISPTSPNPPIAPHQQYHFDNEQEPPISNSISPAQKPLLSTPHKRPTIMNQSPSSFLPQSHHHQSKQFFITPQFHGDAQVSIKTLGHKLFFHLNHTRLLCVHLRILILISLPSLYLFISYPHYFLVLILISIVVFSVTLLISLNIALPSFPYIRTLLARSLPYKFFSTRLVTKASNPVIWSIGSKPRIEKKPNSGFWVQVYRNGDVYEGEFHKGKCSGSGVYYYRMSGRYEGDWVDDKYDGYGVETWTRGSRYRGQYRQGLRHGIGIYRFYTGDVYAGEWSNGQSHGCGIHTSEDGSRYVGEFKCGVKHGLGHYHFRNGDTYAGEYFADKMHGFGVYQFGNGHSYEGAWHEGRRQGLGMYSFRNGETQSGHWQNGVLNVPSMGSCYPASPYAATHSKVPNAIQEARRAAEKAYDVTKVDERVNRAVKAANKAANAARVAAVKAVQRRMHRSNNNNNSDVPTHLV